MNLFKQLSILQLKVYTSEACTLQQNDFFVDSNLAFCVNNSRDRCSPVSLQEQ